MLYYHDDRICTSEERLYTNTLMLSVLGFERESS